MNISLKEPSDWWKSAVLYQIYPRSFYDQNNDGIGDLKGILQKLDYLNDGKGGGLGVDGIWISPFFPSPMVDFGYDVSDFYGVDPIFGTLADFDRLIQEAHKRGIRILIDLVLNHSSDEHPWFIESRKSKDNPKSDWYIWVDPKEDGSPPNNWLSVVEGSAWSYAEEREQYYYHSFYKAQPDFNWYNPEVQEEMRKILRFWLDRSVDGFRLDMLNFFAYDRSLQDNPLQKVTSKVDLEGRLELEYQKYDAIYSKDRPENFEFVKIIRSTLEEYGSHYTTIAEVGGIHKLDKLIQTATSYAHGKELLHMSYTFAPLSNRLNARYLAEIIELTEQYIRDGWPCWSLANHDVSRLLTRTGSLEKTKALLAMLLTLRGTPILYYGDELGMPDYEIQSKEEIQDPFGFHNFPAYKGRDGCRTPFPWNAQEPNQGFNSSREVKTWLPAKSPVTLDQLQGSPNSIYELIHELLRIRKEYSALQKGDFSFVSVDDEGFFYERTVDSETFVVGVNLSDQPIEWTVTETPERIPIQNLGNQQGKIEDNTLLLGEYGFILTRMS